MRYPTVLLLMVLAGCSAPPDTRHESQAADPVEFLLTSAASDFHAHRPPDPVGFRNVRMGHLLTPEGDKRHVLCGQFLPEKGGGTAEWVPFATIKTSGYEQLIGAQAEGFCQGSSVTWDQEGDLSSSLQSRLDSLR